ncbi:MAG: NAD(P)-dependent oxidoreductase, partial [Muribaculaceae bacterium]|nr:NAD(P)-dependent oxidoreductase [Muribaculaceae bacterium]
MKKIFLTGATGVMGSHGLKELIAPPGRYDVTVLARASKKNRKFLDPYLKKGVKVIWGDLLDKESVAKGVKSADIVLHVGGMVSPVADWYPEKTIETNVGAMQHIIEAALPRKGEVKIVYIGSVSQYGHHDVPNHWGQCGDTLTPALFDAYAYSKTEAERMLMDSELRWWVSLRQTGILHSGLLMKASDPIAFHVPIRGVLEWITADDSGRLLERVCRDDVPDSFWCKCYNIGGGAAYRMTNYEFECELLKGMGCPPPEKIFDTNWFATQNFHGFWFADSDFLEDILHFRKGDTPQEYFEQMKRELPWYFSLAPLAPAFALKIFMRHVAKTP